MKEDLAVSLLHLYECMLSVERRNWNVSTIDDTKVPSSERIDVPNGVEATAFFLTRARRTDASWPEAGSWSIRGRGIIGKSYDCDVERLSMCCRETSLPWQMGECYRLRERKVLIQVFERMCIVGSDVDGIQ
jgi:hypothetical protein